MLICGKPVKEWVDAPYGAFAKAVRESIDPNWGADLTVSEVREWKVRVDYRYSGRGEAYYKVKARTEEEAKELALEEFDNDDDIDMFSDAEIDRANVGNARLTK